MGVGVFGEFIEANITGIDGHGLGVGREGEDAGAIVKFDDAHFDFVGEAGGAAMIVKARDFVKLFAVRKDGAGEVKEFGDFAAEAHIFEGAGIIFGGEKIIALFEAETFADVFEGIGEGPTDTDGFFGEGESPLALGVDGVFSPNPVDLVWHEEVGEDGGVVNADAGEDGAHEVFSVQYSVFSVQWAVMRET
jgi:hypothetical protein